MTDWQTNRKGIDRVMIGLFFLVIFLPALLSVFPGVRPTAQLTEKRRLAEWPALPTEKKALIEYPRQFERYFDDHFPFRTHLIQGHNYLKIKVLNQSDQRYVVKGKEGWLFYTHESLLEDFCGRVPFTEERMEAFRLMVEAKRDWLAKRGIAYVFMIPPNKQTIYPEFMPDNFQNARGRTRMDQLMAYMRAHSDVNIVDLRRVLIDTKSEAPLYFKTDTHWNDRGALIGYGDVMRKIAKTLGGDVGKVRTLEDFDVQRRERKGGDLVHMLGLSAYFTDDDFCSNTALDGWRMCAKGRIARLSGVHLATAQTTVCHDMPPG